MKRLIPIAIAVLLAAVIIAGGIFVWSRYRPDTPIEITLSPEPPWQGEVDVGGAVNNPGIYPADGEDSLVDIIRAAGGATANASLNRLELNVPGVTGGEIAQKININRAEVWLLEALPGIGEVRAQAIIDYRRQYGPFRSTTDLLKVDGMGESVYEKIKDLVTVSE